MKQSSKPPTPIYQLALRYTAVLLLASIGLKAIVDVDKNWDVWSYHMPFAGLLWGMSSPETILFDTDIQVRFEGFAIFGEFLQGFFWFITGRFESGNLVGFLSLVLYLYFLKTRFNVPIYLSAIALLAVPLVQMHAVSSYVDLPSSLAVAVTIMMTYRLYARPDEFGRHDLYLLFLGSACAANMRLKLIPIIFIILCFAVPKLILHHYRDRKPEAGDKYVNFLKLSVLCAALAIVFATPIKNTLINGNPVYPVKIQIGSITLNHYESMSKSPQIPGQNTPRPVFWLYSIFEFLPMSLFFRDWVINAWWVWAGTRFGGYFGAYVLFQLIFFVGLVRHIKSRETKIISVIFITMTLVTSIMPASEFLRYYMYWMIVLISINLYLVCHLSTQSSLPKFLSPQSMSLAACVALLIVITFTKAAYVSPRFYSLEDFSQRMVRPELLSSIQKGEGGCVSRRQIPYFYLYSSALNPQLKYQVSYCGRF